MTSFFLLMAVLVIGFTCISVVLNTRPLRFQIRHDAEGTIRELENAFAAAQNIIRCRPDAPQAASAQEILDRLASANLRDARDCLANDPQMALIHCHTGMRNVEGAVRFLAHDTTGTFIGIPGEVDDVVQRLLHNSMNPEHRY
jgi:hypothetical protein